MTKLRPWRMALAMFLSLSLALGFTQNAAAAPGRVSLDVIVNNEDTAGEYLSAHGGKVWVSVESKGLDLSKKYHAAIQLNDQKAELTAEELNLRVVRDHECNRVTNSCLTTATIPVYEKKLAGHTLTASILIYDGVNVVAQDNSHSVKVPKNFEPMDPEAPKEPQNPSVPMPEQNDDANNPGQADQPAPPAIPVPPASDGAGSSSTGSSSTGAIIGAVIGAVALIGIGVAFAVSQAGKFLKFRR